MKYKISKCQDGYIVITPDCFKVYCETLADAKAFVAERTSMNRR